MFVKYDVCEVWPLTYTELKEVVCVMYFGV
jgi:hypothetical protein